MNRYVKELLRNTEISAAEPRSHCFRGMLRGEAGYQMAFRDLNRIYVEFKGSAKPRIRGVLPQKPIQARSTAPAQRTLF